MAVGAAAAGLLGGGFAYASMWPTSQIFGRTLIAGSDAGQIALTFDDGPNEPYTSQILDVLNPIRNHHSPAHPRAELLDEAEAELVCDTVRVLLRYLERRLHAG